jgi:hypothetical protein
MTGPTLEFSLTQEETNVAASRFAWRFSLGQDLLARHLAPLAAFALAITFAALLGLTGLIGRRAAETALLLSAGAYMLYRLWTRRRFLTARRAALVWGETMRAAAPVRLSLDAQGLRLDASSQCWKWRWVDGLEVEEISGLVYVWPAEGEPLVWPTRAEGSEAFSDLVKARASATRRLPSAAPDDDD